MLRNKRGDVSDIITFIIIVFFLAVSFLVVTFANDKISDTIKESALNDTADAETFTSSIDRMTTTSVQRGFVAIFAFLIIGMMASSFLVKIHPVFLFMYIIFLAIAMFVCVPLANTYEILMNANAITGVASQQTMINWIMEHFVIITLGTGALSMIFALAKLTGGESRNEI